MARSLEIAKQMAAPKPPGPRHGCDGAWFEIEPQRAPGPMWLLESADRSRVRVVVASKTLRNARGTKRRSMYFWERTGNDRGRQFGSIAEGLPIRTENRIY